MALQAPIELVNPDGTPFRDHVALLDLAGVRRETRLHDYEIEAGYQNGAFRFAWNIGSGDRVELRVWEVSVRRFLNPKTKEPEALADVVKQILPARSEFTNQLDTAELELVFNASPDLITSLFAAGLLAEHSASSRRAARGPRGKRIATRSSVEKLFQVRRLP